MHELRVIDGDLLLLQEVGTSCFHRYLRPQLDAIGFGGWYAPKVCAWALKRSLGAESAVLSA